MLSRPSTKNDLILLLDSGRVDMVRSFFQYYEDTDDLIDKVLLWCHTFLPGYFRDISPEFHRDIIGTFFSKHNEYRAAPRGFSKTTILQACIMFSIAHRLNRFIVVIEKTFTEAAEVIKGVHDEFKDNEMLLVYYGQMIGVPGIEDQTHVSINHSVQWREAQGDVFINGCRLRGKGFNATIRGLKSRQWRPDLIVLDDVEEDDHIDNPEQRAKYERNYDKGIQPAVDVEGSIKMYGTILHVDSLLAKKIDQHKGKIYSAHDGTDPATASEASFLWPERWPRERLIAKRKDMMSAGLSSNSYAQEYLNKPISEDERVFKFEWLWEMIPDPNDREVTYRVPKQRITVDDFERVRRRTTLNGYAMLDAADATTDSADFTGAVVVFVAPNGARFRVDVKREKRNIRGVIDLIFEIWRTWQPYGLTTIGIEKKAFNDQIVPLFEEEKNKRQIYPSIEELKPMGRSKTNRIKGALEGLYETGKMISLVRVHPETGRLTAVGDTDGPNGLLEELYNFPGSKHDDLSDAEAYQADIAVIPLSGEDQRTPHHTPQDDPFERDQDREPAFAGNVQGQYDDPDAFG